MIKQKGITIFYENHVQSVCQKNVVVEKPYAISSRNSPAFIITDTREFETEKLKEYIKETEANGASYLEGKESEGFGVLSAKEWSNQFYKHLDHHFSQFGV